MPVNREVLIIKSTSVAIRWSTDLKKLVGRMSSSDVEELRLFKSVSVNGAEI